MIDDELRAMLDRIIAVEERMDKVDGGYVASTKGEFPRVRIHKIKDTRMRETSARTLLFMTKAAYDVITNHDSHSFCPSADYIIGWVDDDDFVDEDKEYLPIHTNKDHDGEYTVKAMGRCPHCSFDCVPLKDYYAFIYLQDILDALFGIKDKE